MTAEYGDENSRMRMKAKLPYTIVRAWGYLALSAKETETQDALALILPFWVSARYSKQSNLWIEVNDESRIRQRETLCLIYPNGDCLNPACRAWQHSSHSSPGTLN